MRQVDPVRRSLCLLMAGALIPARARATAVLPAAADLQRDGAVLLLFSLPGCRYCEAVRSEHLLPMHREGRHGGRLAVREVDMASDEPLRDFSGALVSHRDFARAHAVRIAPTVIAFGAAGERLGKPIVGAKLPEFYGYYLANLLEAALATQGRR